VAIRLTAREQAIVEAMLTAATNKVIAERLGISEQSVKNRLTMLYRKVGVSNRLELVLKLMNNDA
jgi:two-component system nitrate/nitrite response regulator NarL